MFQRKINEVFKELPTVFGLADDTLFVWYDRNGTDHDETLRGVLKICRKEKLKLNKDKCQLRYMSINFFGERVSKHGVKPDLHK